MRALIPPRKMRSPKFAALMKLDVEGFEYQLLPHMISEQALCRVDVAFCEFHSNHGLAIESMPGIRLTFPRSYSSFQPSYFFSLKKKRNVSYLLLDTHYFVKTLNFILKNTPDCKTEISLMV